MVWPRQFTGSNPKLWLKSEIDVNYKRRKWSDFDTSFLETFGTDVPVYQPSVFREFRGEIFTTFHTGSHPATSLMPANVEHHTRFSRSPKDVLRGLHYDFATWKLVQALVGEIYFVVLDMRPDSRTRGRWESYILTERTRDQILVPPGFANGHFAMTDCIFHYTLSYSQGYVDETKQGVVAFDDQRFEIKWPHNSPIIQDRDRMSVDSFDSADSN